MFYKFCTCTAIMITLSTITLLGTAEEQPAPGEPAVVVEAAQEQPVAIPGAIAARVERYKQALLDAVGQDDAQELSDLLTIIFENRNDRMAWRAAQHQALQIIIDRHPEALPLFHTWRALIDFVN